MYLGVLEKMTTPLVCLDNILGGWAKAEVQKCLAVALTSLEKQEEERWSRFFEKIQKKYSSSLSRQPSETIKTNHKIGVGKPKTIALSRI